MGDEMRKGKARGWPLPREHYRLLSALRNGLDHGPAAGHLLVAVSGGSDSMALLELVALAASSGPLKVTACHIDHQVRPDGPRERDFVATGAARLGLAFTSRTVTDPGRGDEDHLRRCRYRLLEEAAEAAGADLIVTGHTRDDQIETVLFRLLRGAGLGGLAGMRQRRGRIVRPLLGESRNSLRRFLRDRGVAWLDDPSNADMRYARNRMRHLVVPALETAFGHGTVDHIPELARRWRLDEDHLEAEARRFAAFVTRGHGPAAELDLAALAGIPEALRARVLRNWVGSVGGPDPLTIAQLERVEAIASSTAKPGSVDLPGLVVLYRDGRLLAASPGAGSKANPAARGINKADRVQGPVKRGPGKRAAKP